MCSTVPAAYPGHPDEDRERLVALHRLSLPSARRLLLAEGGRGPPVPSGVVSVPRVYVCTERGCGKRSEHRELAAELEGAAEVVGVTCQSVCDGPVAGVVVGSRLQWFGEVRTRKARAALRRVAEEGRGPLPGALAKRRRSKRSGKLRG